jgi:Fe-S cluster assembly ATP-binding protein
MLVIKNLHVAIEGKKILKGLSLTVQPGEIHALMGPNGAGKSTLSNVLAGHPAYEILEGEILFEGQAVHEMDPEERAALGLFLSFQYPPEISGVLTKRFLTHAYRAVHGSSLGEDELNQLLKEKMELVKMRPEFLERSLNEGFSGGEKKRSEILQMLLLQPKCAVLDETDSGLDIDAMKIVAHGVKHWMNERRGLVMVTHYQRLLDYIQPDYVHVIADGKIIHSGDRSLALELEEKGYDWLTEKAS